MNKHVYVVHRHWLTYVPILINLLIIANDIVLLLPPSAHQIHLPRKYHIYTLADTQKINSKRFIKTSIKNKNKNKTHAYKDSSWLEN